MGWEFQKHPFVTRGGGVSEKSDTVGGKLPCQG